MSEQKTFKNDRTSSNRCGVTLGAGVEGNIIADVMALIEASIEAKEDLPGPRCGIGLPFDLNPVAARRDMDAEASLDGDQVPIVIAEQGAKQVRLLEFDLEAGAGGIVHGAKVGALGHLAA